MNENESRTAAASHVRVTAIGGKEGTMGKAISDFMIHVDESLSGKEMAAIADTLNDNVCVRGACVSESAPHLIMVSYNSDCTRMRDLMRQVRERGVRAEAVGW